MRGALLGSFSGLTSGWRLWLTQHDETRDGNTVTRKLAENTVRRLCGRARQYFRAAQKRRIIDSNPFGEMKDIKVRSTKAPIFHWPLRCQKGYRCVPRRAAETDFRAQPLRRPALPVRTSFVAPGRHQLGTRAYDGA